MVKRKSKGQKPAPSKLQKADFTLVKENGALEEYYQQQFHLAPDDHKAMFQTLKDQLPVTFRINATLRLHQSLISKLQSPEFIQGLSESVQLTEVPWCPGHLIWELSSSKSDLKRCPAAKLLHEFIQKCTDCWLISRQELVSMLPPLLLDVSPGQFVLDMCAAPGSKTAQMVEMLAGSGLIIANDVDINRAFMMVHQLHRANTANLLVTNHPAQQFPGVLKYQRVLCDVPCSGDGTIRKAPTKWKTWNIKDAVGLHPLQVQIATRGFSLLEEGGLMLYSTCSLNPIEDEAVVNTLLTTLGSTASLEDLPAIINQKYPGLRYRPGLTHWKLLGNAHIPSPTPFVEYTNVSDFPQGSKFRPSMLCEAPNPALQKCVRIFPQDQNSGGFFLALFRKSGEVPKETEETEEKLQGKIPVPRRKVHKGMTEYLEVEEGSDEYQSISDYYGFSEDFPQGSLFTPSAVHKKNIYLISSTARKVLDLDERKALRVVNMGVKAFSVNKERASTQDCKYRICQDAAPFLLQYLTKRTYVSSSASDFATLLTHKQVSLSDLTDEGLKSALSSANGYFVLHFQAVQIDEIIVVLKHMDDRIILMIPDELVRGLKLLYDLE